jgi:hypothetical protein
MYVHMGGTVKTGAAATSWSQSYGHSRGFREGRQKPPRVMPARCPCCGGHRGSRHFCLRFEPFRGHLRIRDCYCLCRPSRPRNGCRGDSHRSEYRFQHRNQYRNWNRNSGARQYGRRRAAAVGRPCSQPFDCKQPDRSGCGDYLPASAGKQLQREHSVPADGRADRAWQAADGLPYGAAQTAVSLVTLRIPRQPTVRGSGGFPSRPGLCCSVRHAGLRR